MQQSKHKAAADKKITPCSSIKKLKKPDMQQNKNRMVKIAHRMSAEEKKST